MLMKHSKTEDLTDTVKKKNEWQIMCSTNYTSYLLKNKKIIAFKTQKINPM